MDRGSCCRRTRCSVVQTRQALRVYPENRQCHRRTVARLLQHNKDERQALVSVLHASHLGLLLHAALRLLLCLSVYERPRHCLRTGVLRAEQHLDGHTHQRRPRRMAHCDNLRPVALRSRHVLDQSSRRQRHRVCHARLGHTDIVADSVGNLFLRLHIDE